MTKLPNILSDVAHLKGGYAFKSSDYTPSGRFILRTVNITDDGRIDRAGATFISEKDAEEYSNFELEDGDTLFVMVGATLGKVGLVTANDLPALLNQNMWVIRAKDPDVTCKRYLNYWFKDTVKRTMQWASGSARGFVTRDDYRSLPFPSVKIETQRQIAQVLVALDTKIELNQRINEELEGMAKLLYDYWFVQYDFPMSAAQAAALGKPHLTGHPYRASGGPMTYHETLKREIPQGWEVGAADALFDFNPTTKLKDGTLAGYFDMDAVPTRGFMTKKAQRKAFSGGTKFMNGDVVVARITPCLENGKTALITQLEEEEVGFGSTEFIVLRGKMRSLSAFGACLARSEAFRKFAITNMTGTSGRKRIDAPVLKTYPMSIPPSELLVRFEEACFSMFHKMTLNEQQTQELTPLRDWLLPMLMNGQVTVG